MLIARKDVFYLTKILPRHSHAPAKNMTEIIARSNHILEKQNTDGLLMRSSTLRSPQHIRLSARQIFDQVTYAAAMLCFGCIEVKFYYVHRKSWQYIIQIHSGLIHIR